MSPFSVSDRYDASSICLSPPGTIGTSRKHRLVSPKDASTGQSQGRRRVIFPSLHQASPPEIVSPQEQSAGNMQPPRWPLLGALSLPVDDKERGANLLSRLPLHANMSPWMDNIVQACRRFDVNDLVIPPFKGGSMDETAMSQNLPQKVPGGNEEQVLHSISRFGYKVEFEFGRHSTNESRGVQKRPSDPPPSILRSNSAPITNPVNSVTFTEKGTDGSILESIPSLMSLNDEEEDSQSFEDTLRHPLSTIPPSRKDSVGDSPLSSPRTIAFDPRVWVVEYELSEEERKATWFSQSELDHFRRQALARVYALHNTEFLPTGTGRLVRLPLQCKALYTHPSMTLDGNEDEDVEEETKEQIRNVLVVDPHDIFLKLFVKAFKNMLPHVKVTTALSSEEAIRRFEASGSKMHFDIVIVEERLKLFHQQAFSSSVRLTSETADSHSSGSGLIKALLGHASGMADERKKKCLFIAVSAHLDKDKETLEKSDADFVWSKPPPALDESMRNTLLKALLVKRGKHATASKLFEPAS